MIRFAGLTSLARQRRVGTYVPMLKVVQDGEESDGGTAGFRSLIDEIVRDGARKMLAAALQAEVAAYVEQFADQVDEDGRRLVVRNGYHQPRTVVTSAGAVEVKAPRVNDKRTDPETGERQRFSSAILPHGRDAPRRSLRFCRCCTCTAYPQATSLRRSSSSSAQARACRHHPSPG